MSVARRAGLGFLALLVLSSAGSVLVFALASRSTAALTRYQNRTSLLNTAVANMQSDFYNYDDQMNMYVAVIAGSASQKALAETTYQQAVAAGQSLGQDLAQAERLSPSPKITALLNRVDQDYVGYNGFANETRAAGLRDDVAKALYVQTVGNLVPSNDIMPTLTSVANLVNAQVKQTLASIHHDQSLAEIFTLSSVVLTAVLILTLGLMLRRWVLGPINDLRTRMTAISTGQTDRQQRIPIVNHDELGQVGEAFNMMLDSLDQSDRDLAASQAEREERLQENFWMQRNAQQQLRARAQEMIDTTAATVGGELTDVLSQVAEVRSAAGTIDQRVAATDTLTRSAVTQADFAGRVVTDLTASLREVADMAELIADVSKQTKLLALNATLEAARAGQAGTGFSVVAHEVKELAAATEVSTSRIAATIASLEASAATVTEAIEAMTAGITGVDDSTAALTQVASDQQGLLEILDRTISESIRRITEMSSLTDELERRSAPRAAITSVATINASGRDLSVTLVDISEGGLRCTLPTGEDLRADLSVEVTFSLQGRSFTQRAIVLSRESRHGEVGLQFVDPTAGFTSAVNSYIESIGAS